MNNVKVGDKIIYIEPLMGKKFNGEISEIRHTRHGSYLTIEYNNGWSTGPINFIHIGRIFELVKK